MAHGSVFRKDGGWAFRVDAGINPETGRRRQILRQGFATKKAAEQGLADAHAANTRGVAVARSMVRVEEYFTDWLVTVQAKLRPSTYYSYEVIVGRITKQLGHYQLQALTPLQIERFYSDLAKSGGRTEQALSPKTVRNTHVVMRKALADAERLGLVSRNAAAAARPPASPKGDLVTWSSEDLRAFLAAIEGNDFEIGFWLLAATGMRRGEVLGLRWRDVDIDLGQIAISHTITNAGSTIVMGPPKTPRSRRNVYIDKRTVEMLKAYRKRQREWRLAAGPGWDSSVDVVLTDQIGRWVRPDTFSREFERVIGQLDVPRVRLHDLRHTHATLALKAGVHPKVVSERLGHATVGVTLDLYSHVVPALARDAAEQIMRVAYGEVAEADNA